MKTFNIITAAIFIGTVGVISYNLISGSGKHYLSVTNVGYNTVEENLRLSGFVYPDKEIEIKPQISGVVYALHVKVGDSVKEGSPIASISLVPNSSEVERLANNMRISRINLNAAKANYDRQKFLLDKKVISKADFELAERDYMTAKENYSSASSQLNFRQKNDKASNNIVRSSTSGVIIDIPVKVGASVVERGSFNAGTTIATIAEADHYIFKANVPERDIGNLSLGMPVRLTLLVHKNIEIPAVITNISAKGEVNGGTVKFPVEAEFSLDNDMPRLRSGYSATAEILISRVSDAMTLPEKYIHFNGDTSFVYVTDSLKRSVTERIVKLGISDGDNVQIVNGLTDRDLIITNYHD